MRWRRMQWIVVCEEVVTERCFASAWKCVEQDDSVYPSIRSSRGGGAKQSAGGRG